jgi:DNA polymerase III delta prime subunit
MPPHTADPRELLRRSLAADRVHSAYLLSGPGEEPREAALWFARALACSGPAAERPCESCPACRRSTPGEPVPLDGAGRNGPLLRHVGDHPDLLWVERGADDTRVRIGQIRAMQSAFRLSAVEGGRRAAVVADAEWLNQEAQNALLRILEEPPRETSLLLVTHNPEGLLATVRSRCQRLSFAARRPPAPSDPEAPEEQRALAERLDRLVELDVPGLLDWAEEFRGPRAIAAAGLSELLGTASGWLHDRACRYAESGGDAAPLLASFQRLQACRKSLVQRNANPQLVAEQALFALRDASR